MPANVALTGILALILGASCRDQQSAIRASNEGSSARDARSVAAHVPPLPRSDDGRNALTTLDASIAAARDDLLARVPLLLERAAIRGRLEDYEAALADTARLTETAPHERRAWPMRIDALVRTHQIAAAQEALDRASKVLEGDMLAEQQIAIDHARGKLDVVIAARKKHTLIAPTAHARTLYAATLAEAGELDAATAQIWTAAGTLRSNTPQYIAWLLFQWGRIHELAGRPAIARAFYADAHQRLPGHLETVLHLAALMAAAGEREAARSLTSSALADNPHPALRASVLEYENAPPSNAELDAVALEWERYVAALPLAFADHAARFYLGVGNNPARALALAQTNAENRPTLQAHALVVEAALAAKAIDVACAHASALSAGTRQHQFLAWTALSACKRGSAADALARQLGITP